MLEAHKHRRLVLKSQGFQTDREQVVEFCRKGKRRRSPGERQERRQQGAGKRPWKRSRKRDVQGRGQPVEGLKGGREQNVAVIDTAELLQHSHELIDADQHGPRIVPRK